MVRRLRHLFHTHRRVGLLFVEQGVVSGCGFVTTLLLVRALGLEAYGIFGLILAMTLFVLGLQLALVSQPMMAVGPKLSLEERPEFFGSMLLLQSVFTVLATLGTAVAYATVQRSFPEAGLAGTLVPATPTAKC